MNCTYKPKATVLKGTPDEIGEILTLAGAKAEMEARLYPNGDPMSGHYFQLAEECKRMKASLDYDAEKYFFDHRPL